MLTAISGSVQPRVEMLGTLTFSRAAGEIDFVEGVGSWNLSRLILPTESARTSKTITIPPWCTDLGVSVVPTNPGAASAFTVVSGAFDWGVWIEGLTIPKLTTFANGVTSFELVDLMLANSDADNFDNASGSGGWDRPALLLIGPNVTQLATSSNTSTKALAAGGAISWVYDMFHRSNWGTFDPSTTTTIASIKNTPLGETMGVWFQPRVSTTLASLEADQANLSLTFHWYGIRYNS